MNVASRSFARQGFGAAVRRLVADLLPESHAPGDPPEGATAVALWEAAFAGPEDAGLLAAARALRLGQADLLPLVLLRELERDARLPAALRALQGGAGPWPGLALVWRMQEALGHDPEPPLRALELGVIETIGGRAPGPELRLALSRPALRALGPRRETRAPPLPEDWSDWVAALAQRLCGRRVAILMRHGDAADRRALAAALAARLGRRCEPVAEDAPGLGAACTLGRWLPVETLATLAGRRSPALPLEGCDGPRVILCGHEGGVQLDGWDMVEATPPLLSEPVRRALWDRALPRGLAAAAAVPARIGPSRIAAIAARVALGESGSLRAAMGEEFRPEMEPHAALVPDEVSETSLALAPPLRPEFDLLIARCRFPGTAGQGVRALLSGPSGTGKTLACAWLSCRLGLPLFRVDLSSVVSKYIGETEENLARLLDRAEAGDMVLLLDEADSLFGTRTETRDSSDRYANNQTNYLLSRIERFSGIALLTSNGPERIDPAFRRRLDQVIEMPPPGPAERRIIWTQQLGHGHALDGASLNRLSGLADLSGGHIRSAARTARVLAGDRPVGWDEVLRAVTAEYRKLGRSMPGGLAR